MKGRFTCTCLCCLIVACSLAAACNSLEFDTYESELTQPAPVDSVAAPGDYDGDGCTDIAVKGSNGNWYIDFCANGFGTGATPPPTGRWDAIYYGYGDATAIPVPADYDGDGLTDIAVKDASGTWSIDYAANGFGSWDLQVFNYGFANAVPVPADYDGDGKADLATKDSFGEWSIDFSADGFHGYNWQQPGYGDATSVPVPGYYSGNGHCSITTTQACSLTSQCPANQKCYLKADLAIKDSAGHWNIDSSTNGFGGPVHCNPITHVCTQALYDLLLSGYGNAASVPVPADYDGDGYTDLAIKDSSGNWFVDQSKLDNNGNPCASPPCFGGWNVLYPGPQYGGSSTTAVPGSYHHDGLDLSVKDNTTGFWYIDWKSDGFGSWNQSIDTTNRQLYNSATPFIASTYIYGPDGHYAPCSNNQAPPCIASGFVTGVQWQLTIGVRYTVAVGLNGGNPGIPDSLGLELNPALNLPPIPPSLIPANLIALNLQDPVATGAAIPPNVISTRRFAITCSQPGSYPLGFQLSYDASGTEINPFNPDYGIRVDCIAPTTHPTGLSGRVTVRGCQNIATGTSGTCGTGTSTDLPYIVSATSAGISGATVSVDGVIVCPSAGCAVTASNGSWSIPTIAAGPHTVTVSAAGYSSAIAVNLTVPTGSGLELDTPLEESFSALAANHMVYTTYLDYSRGRTIFHTVTVPISYAAIRPTKTTPYQAICSTNNNCPYGEQCVMGVCNACDGTGCNLPNSTIIQSAAQIGAGALALINGSYFDGNHGSNYMNSQGYLYSRGYTPSEVLGGGSAPDSPGSLPLLSISGLGINQQVSMPESECGFTSSTSLEWAQSGTSIWDVAPRNNVSDLDYGIQGAQSLVLNGAIFPSTAPNPATGQVGDPSWGFPAIGIATAANYVTRDATSGWFVPANASEWTRFLQNSGISNPIHLWNCQEVSGNLSDSIGTQTLTAAGPPLYQNQVAGWSRLAVGLDDTSGGYFAEIGGAGNIGATSALLLALVELPVAPTATRDMFGMGAGASYRGVQATTTPYLKATPNDGSAMATGTANVGTVVRPVIIRVDRTNHHWNVISDLGTVTPTPWTAPPAGSGGIFIGAAITSSAKVRVLYMAEWEGAAAEMTDAQVTTLIDRFKTGPAALATTAYLVVADAEGVSGGNGATLPQLSLFFRDVLHTSSAMRLDGGYSTEMVLRGAAGSGCGTSPCWRHVNTITPENNFVDIDPYSAIPPEYAGGPGSPANFITTGQ